MTALIAATLAAASPGLPVTAREMVEVTDISSVAIAPDGRSVAFREERASIERNSYALEWFVASLDEKGEPRHIGDAGEGTWRDGVLVSEPPAWSPDGRWIYFRAIRDGQVQLWRAASDGSGAEPLSHEDGNVAAFAVDAATGGIIYRVGASRAAIEGAEQAEYDRGVHVDATVDPSRGLFRSDRIDGRSATTRLNGFWFAHGGLLDDAPPIFRHLDPGTGVVRAATPSEAALLKPRPGFFDRIDGRLFNRVDSQDSRGSAYIVQTNVPGIEQLAITDRSTLAGATLCGQPQCVGRHIVNAQWARTGGRLVFATSAPGIRHSLHVWDAATGTVTTIAASEGTLDGGRDGSNGCAIGDDDAVCVAATANDPPQLIRFPLRGGPSAVLADPNAVLRRNGAALFRPLTWIDQSGRPNTGQLLVPERPGGARPLFIIYYNCDGYLRGGTGDEFPLRQLAEHGVGILCINRTPSPSLGNQLDAYRTAQAAIDSAVALLVKEGLVDRRRIGLGGLSFGGEVALWTAMHGDLVSAISVSSILLTPTYYWFNAMKGRETPDVLKRVWGLGTPDRRSERWRDVSAFYNPGALQSPILMQLPEHEMRVTFPLAAKLSRTTTPCDLWAFPDEDHIKTQPRHKLAVYQRNLDWFLYWLKGEVDPAPQKKAQYAYWESFARKPGWNDNNASSARPAHAQLRSQASTSIRGRIR